MINRHLGKSGFALPTVLIASVVMMIVLVSAIGATFSVNSAINGQYQDSMIQQAAKSGMEMAEACLEKDGGIANWTDIAPLRPNTNCSGVVVVGDSASIFADTTRRTSFEVPAPKGEAGNYEITAKGIINLIRKSDGASWKTSISSFSKKFTGNDIAQLGSMSDNLGTGQGCFVIQNGDVYCFNPAVGYTLSKIILPAAANNVSVSPQGMAMAGVGASNNPIFNRGYFACADLANDEVYCWNNGTSQYMASPYRPMPFGGSPTKLNLPSGLKISSMSVGPNQVCLVSTSGSVYCLDSDIFTTDPVQVNFPAVVTKVQISRASVDYDQLSTSSFYHSDDWYACALMIDSKVSCWDESPEMPFSGSPAIYSFPGGVGVKDMSFGATEACFLLINGDVYCDEATGGPHDPQQIILSADASSIQLSSSSMYHSFSSGTLNDRGNYACAMLITNGVECWGGGGSDVNNSFNFTSQPTFPSGTSIRAMALGASKACFMSSTGSVYCLGVGSSAVMTQITLPAAAKDIMVAPGNTRHNKMGASSNYIGSDWRICILMVDGKVGCLSSGTTPTLLSFPGNALVRN